MRLVLQACVAVLGRVLFLLFTGSAAAQPLYHLQDLGQDSYPRGQMTPDGKFAGSYQNHAAYWDGGRWVLLTGAKAAAGVSETGEAAGTRGILKRPRARVWTPKGHHHDILPDAGRSYVTTVSANGVVYGYEVTGDFVYSSFSWHHDLLTILPLAPNGGLVVPRAANRAGQIAGDEGTPMLFDDGAWTALGDCAGQPRGINELGQVVGYCYLADGYRRDGFVFADGVLTDLGFLSQAWAINDAGDIVGEQYDDDMQTIHAFILKSGTNTPVRLDQLVDQLPGDLLYAVSINDAGEIAVYGADSLGWPHAYLLTPL